jgi:hypothetical protein
MLTCTGTIFNYRKQRWTGDVARMWVLHFLQATKALRESRGIALLCFYTTALDGGWGVSVTPQPLSIPGKDPVPIVQETGWAPGPVWTGAENLAPTGIRSPNRPARSSVAIPTELPGPQLECRRRGMKGGGITERPEVGFIVILLWRLWQKEKGFVDLEIERNWHRSAFSLPRVRSGIADVISWVLAIRLRAICIYVNGIALNTYKKRFHLIKPQCINLPRPR